MVVPGTARKVVVVDPEDGRVGVRRNERHIGRRPIDARGLRRIIPAFDEYGTVRRSADPEGYRQEVLFRYCCALLRWGLSEDEIKDAAQRYNRSRMRPMLQAMEVAQTARNVYRNQRYRASHDASVREVVADADFSSARP
jgi:hypothetical protein